MIPARKHFLTGIAVILPVILTLLVVQYILRAVNSWIAGPIFEALPFDVDKDIAVLSIKALILVALIVIVYVIGWGTQIFIVKQVLQFGEHILERVPMVNRVYSTIKEMSTAFIGDRKDLFKTAVIIEYPRKGIYSIAFITGTSHTKLSKQMDRNLVSVFLPTTPNPTSGVLLFLPKEDLIDLPMTVEEAIKLVISGGTVQKITNPPELTPGM